MQGHLVFLKAQWRIITILLNPKPIYTLSELGQLVIQANLHQVVNSPEEYLGDTAFGKPSPEFQQ